MSSTNINTLWNFEGFVFNQHKPMEIWWDFLWFSGGPWLFQRSSVPRCSGSCPGNCRTTRVWCSRLTSLALENCGFLISTRMGFEFEFGWDIEPNKYWNICTYYICMYIIYITVYIYMYIYILYTSGRSQSGIKQRYEKGYRTMKIYWIYWIYLFFVF